VANDRTTRERIIAAVLENAFVKSAEGTSLADIALRVGIKKASLYNHFENRDGIFGAVCAYCGQFMAANPYIPPGYEATVQKHTAPVLLKGIVRRYLKVYEKDLPLRIYTFVAAEKYFLEDAYAVHRREEEKILSQMTVLFRALKKFGKFGARFDPEKDAFWFAGAMGGHVADRLLALKNAAGKGGAPGDPERDPARVIDIDAQIDWFCDRSDFRR
jgi:AcrR family transcriptional regulator